MDTSGAGSNGGEVRSEPGRVDRRRGQGGARLTGGPRYPWSGQTATHDSRQRQRLRSTSCALPGRRLQTPGPTSARPARPQRRLRIAVAKEGLVTIRAPHSMPYPWDVSYTRLHTGPPSSTRHISGVVHRLELVGRTGSNIFLTDTSDFPQNSGRQLQISDRGDYGC